MGKKFLLAKRERLLRKRDLERLRMLGTPDLNSRIRDRLEKLVRFSCPESDPAEGTVVMLCDEEGCRSVSVYLGNSNVRIGWVDETGSIELREIIARYPHVNGVLNCTVCHRRNPLSGYAAARLNTFGT